MAKDSPQVVVTLGVDHGDGTATVMTWSDVELEGDDYGSIIQQHKDLLGDPDFSQIVPVTYNDEGEGILKVQTYE